MHSIAVIGLGNRGSGYLRWLRKYCADRAYVAAVCEPVDAKREAAQKRYGVPRENCYASEKDFFAAGRLAEALFICTGDRDHYAEAVQAIELGYHILLEKPISPVLSECLDLLRRADEKGVYVVVCHVMRYMPYFQALHDLVTDGRYGKLIGVDHTENIGYFHFAHSYVRGNWRREDETAPMLLAKSSHDFDFINWLMGGGCQSVSSIGALDYFTPEHAPAGAADRCLDCPNEIRKVCPYEAVRLYITPRPHHMTFLLFMGDVLTGKPHFKRRDQYEALRTGPYGRCVFRCDNDVCDRQSTLMDYGGGRTATATTTAFSQKSFRRTILQLEHADVIGESGTGRITIRPFGGRTLCRRIGLVHIVHRAGDQRIIRAFVDLLDGKPPAHTELTFLSESIESHRLVFLAEESRKANGVMVSAARSRTE